MLIYANNFKIINPDRERKVFNIIKGWLKQVTKKDFSIEELKSGSDFPLKDGGFVRIIKSDLSEPKLYSIKFSHADKDVRGREWVSELGVKIEKDFVFLSILVETFEQSTLVNEQPVASRPKIIDFLNTDCQFHSEIEGLNVKYVSDNLDSWKAFKNEIERNERSLPIVLISSVKEGDSFVDANKLQNHLVGLAQVVELNSSISSYDLENFMETSKYCAWDGAINIIYPKNKFGNVRNTLLLKDKLIELSKQKNDTFRAILSYITNYTNLGKRSEHLTPTDVKMQSLKDRRNNLKSRLEELSQKVHTSSDNEEYKDLAEELFLQLSQQEEEFGKKEEEMKFEIEKGEAEKFELESKCDYLQARVDELVNSSDDLGKPIITYGNEKDLYKDEVKLIVGEILNKALEELESSNCNTRRYHILKDIINNNDIDLKTKNDFIKDLKVAFKGITQVSKKQLDVLKEFNIELISEVPHNAIGFKADERYSVTFGKTISDKRAGDNIVRDIKKHLL